ncbi:MAG: oligosaccharide flippase family protein [Clostridia bacterium]|nr:oligosaccharide flippase family protein [Clostridia bacterium]
MRKKDSLFCGAFTLALGGFVTKIIGAIYRIPLTNILGSEGIGIYQMVFPLYCLLLTVSSTGVPNGIAKLIAEGNDAEVTLKSALKIFVPIGLLGSAIMMVFSNKIASLQGNSLATVSYIYIAPSVLAVSIISCFRGYYQGFLSMNPTAISQVLEQVVKLSFGLTLAFVFRKNTAVSASMAALSVTISEVVTVFYLCFIKKRKGGFNFLKVSTNNYKKIIKTVVPITFSTIIMPLTRTVESFIIFNILNKYLNNATSLYGLYSGAVESLVSVPVSILYSIAVTSVPLISRESGNKYIKTKKPLILTLIGSVIFAVGFYLCSSLFVKILYRRLSYEDTLVAIKMAKMASLSVLTLPLMQTFNACLIACGHIFVPSLTSLTASVIKIILSIFLLNIKSVNIFAVIITDIICYLVACLLNLVYIIRNNKYKLVES